MKRALYIGKFQPFHIGHLSVVEHIAHMTDIDEIIIAIGSSQWNWKNPNPDCPLLDNIFTWEERKEMIEQSLRGRISKKFHVVSVLDFLPKWGSDSTPKWFAYIKSHCPQFHCLVTNRAREVMLFSGAGYETRPHPLTYGFAATHVREKMATGGLWHPFVSPEAARVIKRIGGAERAVELFSKIIVEPHGFDDLCWEWRTFDRPNEHDIQHILRLPLFRDETVSDIYLYSLARSTVNFKLRKGGCKVKKLIAVQDGIEAWGSYDCDLPMDKNIFIQGCREIKFPAPSGLPDPVTEKSILRCVPQETNPYVFLLAIEKERRMRIYKKGASQCGVDISTFSLGGRTVVSIGIEARSKKDVEEVIAHFDLRRYRAVNYIQFLEKFVLKEAGDAIWEKL